MSLKSAVRSVKQSQLLITPRLTEYLMTHPDFHLSVPVADMLHKQMVSVPRVRKSSFSASSSGRCPRQQVLAYLGAPVQGAFDDRTVLLFANGHFIHLMLQSLCLEAGILRAMEVPARWPRKRTMGTMDGVGDVPPDHVLYDDDHDEFIVDFKGINDWGFKAAVKADDPDNGYKRQIAKYMLITGINVAVIFYINKNTQETKEWVYTDRDLKVYLDEGRREVDVLNHAVDSKRLPPLLPGARTNINPDCQGCAFGGPTGICLSTGDWYTP